MNENLVLNKVFERPEYHFHIRELAKETKLHPNTVIKLVDNLFKEGIVKRERRKMVVEVYANVESEQYKRKKMLFNIESLYSKGLVDFLIEAYNQPKAIILIGSFLRGEDFSKSDVDVIVVSKDKKVISLDKYEKLLKRKIHLLALEYKDISKEFLSNLINGFVLYGAIEYDKI